MPARTLTQDPKKHWVYGIETTWQDTSWMIVWRRYSEFRDLHLALAKSCGSHGSDKPLPDLPGRTIINNENGAMGRVGLLNEYLEARPSCVLRPHPFPMCMHTTACWILLKGSGGGGGDDDGAGAGRGLHETPDRSCRTADPTIHHSTILLLTPLSRTVPRCHAHQTTHIAPVLDMVQAILASSTMCGSVHFERFVQPRGTDVAPPLFDEEGQLEADMKKARGSTDEVARFSISSGFIELEQHVALADFAKTDPDQINLTVGDGVEVINKNDSGWWFVSTIKRIPHTQGWVPATYLQPVKSSVEVKTEDTQVQAMLPQCPTA